MDVKTDDVVAESPPWFATALRAPVKVDTVVVDGKRISYRAWGNPCDPGVVLVHGSAANARWWDHIAPQLADGRHVVAMDFSGHSAVAELSARLGHTIAVGVVPESGHHMMFDAPVELVSTLRNALVHW